LTRLSLGSLLKATIRKAVPLLCHESPIIDVLKAVLVVRPKREKEVYPRNRSVFFELWIEQEILLQNLYAKEE